MQPTEFDALRAQASASARQAYAPYSRLHVGAALRSGSGKVYCGCNVENGALPLSTCAERSAIAAAVVAEGPLFRLSAIAVVAITEDGTVQSVSPCGACRQLIAESGPQASVGFVGADQQWIIAPIAELLPYAFVLPET